MKKKKIKKILKSINWKEFKKFIDDDRISKFEGKDYYWEYDVNRFFQQQMTGKKIDVWE